MNLRFDDSSWLFIGASVALVLVLPALHWLSGMSSLRRWSAVLARVVLVAILAALIAGVTLRRESDRLAVIAVIDVSGSVRKFAGGIRGPDDKGQTAFDAAKAFLLAAAGEQAVERKADDLLGVVAFDGSSAAILAPARITPASLAAELEALTPVAMREGTDIGGALNLAMSLAPPGVRTRLLLISDGVQTGGGSGVATTDVAQIARDLGLRAGFESAGESPLVDDRDVESSAESDEGRRGRAVWGGVDVLPIEYDVKNEVVVESLDAPPRISARAALEDSAPGDRTIQLRVVLQSASAARGLLSITDQGVAVDVNGPAPGLARPLTLAPGRHVEVVEVPISNERVHRYEAIFEPEAARAESANAVRVDTIAENNRARAFTLAAGRPTVLIIDGFSSREQDLSSPDGLTRSGATRSAATSEPPSRDGTTTQAGSQLARTLEASGFSVRSIPPEAFKPDLLELQTVDAVLLQSVPADALDPEAQKALIAYVRDMGGGLAMIGGPDSFAPGGWKGSPIEPILPVRLDLPEQLVTPAAATVIVLDVSGSMRRTVMGTTRTQMEIAAEGAARAIESIDRSDLIGVVTFSDETDVVVPLGPNTNPQRSADRVRGVGSDGGTIIGPALQIAWDQLKAVKADEKHVIVLTDGRSTDSDILAGMCERMRKDDIRTSTIAVGDETDIGTLSDMASVGAGKFYRVIDPTLLPRIFIKAVRVVRSPMIRREAFAPVISSVGCPVAEEVLRAAASGGSVVGSSASRSVPPLSALVLTQPRPDPGITYSMATPKGEPLLAYWNVGTGKVAAWTSDTEEWSAAWHPWSGYARLWSRLLTLIARPAADRGMNLRTQIIDDQLQIRLEALDVQGVGGGAGAGAGAGGGGPIDGLRVPATVFMPSGERREIMLEPVGAGQYQATLPATEGGVYVVSAVPTTGSASASASAGASPGSSRPYAPVIAGVSRTEGIEYRRLTSDRATLEQIARATGGRVLRWDAPGEAKLFDRTGIRPAQARLPLWRPLLWAALVVMLLDVATRRVAWDRFVSREFGDQVRKTVRATLRDRSDQAAGTLGKLREKEPGREVWSGQPGRGEAAPLGDEAALEIMRREAERRRAARVQPASASAPSSASTKTTTPAPDEPTIAKAPEPPTASEPGLFAAKKRARDRMSGNE